MNRNVEIKARIRGDGQLRHILSRIGKYSPEILNQRDIFFHIPRGRLKLRETESSCEIIYYDRQDQIEPSVSEYLIIPLEDAATHRNFLEASLGIRGIVSKHRRVYRHGQTRVHIDDVDSLGLFIELEVVLAPDQSVSDGEKIAHRMMDDLDIRSGDLISSAYIDLIETSSGSPSV